MTPMQISRAWFSVKDRWIVRRNKAHDTRQWEVVHDFGFDLISDETMKVVGRFREENKAQRKARLLEHKARGAAVLAEISR